MSERYFQMEKEYIFQIDEIKEINKLFHNTTFGYDFVSFRAKRKLQV